MKSLRSNKTLATVIIIPCLFVGSCRPTNLRTGERTALRVRSLVSVPRSEQEFASIFRNRATSGQLDSVSRNGERFARAGAELLNSRQHLLNLLEDDTSGIVLLVGHNVGGNFMFPDGSYISFEAISRTTNVNRIVVLISCNSKDYASQAQIGISRAINYDEAGIMLNRMLENFNVRTDLDLSDQNYYHSLGEIEQMLQAADQRAFYYYRVRKSGPYVVGGGALITYIVIEPQNG